MESSDRIKMFDSKVLEQYPSVWMDIALVDHVRPGLVAGGRDQASGHARWQYRDSTAQQV
jgi:hypothetical protein